MTFSSGMPLYRQIIENAQAATMAVLVVFARLAPDGREVQLAAWASSDAETWREKLDPVRRALAATDHVFVLATADEGPWWHAVFLEGKQVSLPLEDLAGDSPGDAILKVCSDLGIQHAVLYPLKVWTRVEGAILFLTVGELGEPLRCTCKAFVDQAALLLENAVLCEVLQVQLEQVQESRRQMTAAEERLRQQLAELLHGEVQNKLIVAWHRLGECETLLDADRPRALALIEEAKTLIDTVRDKDVRDASHRLHPSMIRIGLAPAVRSLASNFESDFLIDIKVDPRLQSIDGPLTSQIPQSLRLAAYRVVEEALNNVNGHARASRVDISLEISGENILTVVVRDDGCGFEMSSMQRGLGLNSIAGRMEEAGGALSIDSAIGSGTTVSAQFPLDIVGTTQPI